MAVIPGRALAVVLSLLLSALPAAAQIRSVPVEAGSSPLSARAGFAPPAASFSPALDSSLSAPSLGPSLAAPAAAPSPEAAKTPAAAAQSAALLAATPVLAATPAFAAMPARAAPPAAAIPERPEASASAAAAAAADAALTPNVAALATPDPVLDAVFDGRRDADGLSTVSAPQALPVSSALKPAARSRVWRFTAVTTPAVAAAAVFGAAAPQAALGALHWLGESAYWLANPFAFAFTIPQIHLMLSRRSADVSTAMVAVGLFSTLVTSLNFAYDGKDLMMYRNLAQWGGFAAMLALKSFFARAPSSALPSRRRAAFETAAVTVGIGGVLLLAGPALAAAMPAVAAMGALLVPLQVLSGFGFTYLMYAQLSKMRRASSAGDSSAAMMWAYLGTKMIWVWSLATMLALSTAPAWLTLAAGALFTGVCWLAGKATLSRLLKAPWSFLPEKLTLLGRALTRQTMAEISSFLILSALILALSAGAYLVFIPLLGIPAATAPRFTMYLLYMVQSLVACLATLKTLRMHARFDKK